VYIRYRVSEFDDIGGHAWTWYVDVPEGMEAKAAAYRFTRHKGMYNISNPKKHNMDSPTVRDSGVRKNVETAMRLYFGGRGEVWHENAIKRTEVYRMGKVTRDPSRQTKRLSAPLHVVSVEMKNEILTIGLILDDDTPVRYAAEVKMSDYHRFSAWKILMYRRLNPRSHGKPEYGLRVMPAGTTKAEAYINEPINFVVIDDCIAKLRKVIPEGTKASTTLSILERQAHKQESLHWGAAERGKNTISYRIFSTATPVCEGLHAVMTNPTPEAVAHWTSISETIKANMQALGPKFEARLRNLEAQHFLNLEKAKQAKQAAQTPSNSFIPPMPTLPWDSSQTAPQAPETPANTTGQGLNALTAFLGDTDHAPQSTQPETTRQSDIDLEREVREFLAAIPKD
jgi:hypothetical protein